MSQVGERKVVLIPQRTIAAAGTSIISLSPVTVSGYTSVIFALNVTAQSGTTPTLDIYIQQELPIVGSSDKVGDVPQGTSVWNDFVHLTQVTTSTGAWFASITGGSNATGPQKDGTLAAATVISGPIGSRWQVKEIVAGTSPSYTYGLCAILIP